MGKEDTGAMGVVKDVFTRVMKELGLSTENPAAEVKDAQVFKDGSVVMKNLASQLEANPDVFKAGAKFSKETATALDRSHVERRHRDRRAPPRR